MLLIYFLLIIIAIGVLLASEAGQQFLNFLIRMLLLGGALFILLIAVVLIVGILSNKDVRENITYILGAIMIVVYIFYGIKTLIERKKKGDFTSVAIKNRIKQWWNNNWTNSIGGKIGIIIVIICFSAMVLLLIYGSIKFNDFWH